MAKLDSIIDKIRALQAKAQDSSCTEAEAAAFAAKVSELLIKHNLDKGILDAVQEKELIESQILNKNFVHPWRPILANAVGKLYFCRVLIITVSPTSAYQNAKKRLMFIGKAQNRAVAISMFEHFEKTIRRMGMERFTRKGDLDTFERSCGLHLSDRILDIYLNLQKPILSGDRSVPVLFKSEQEEVDQFTNKNHRPVAGKNRKFDLNGDAAHEGMRAANQIQINNQLM